MAYTFSTNLIPVSDAHAMFLFKEFAKTAGWSVVGSGDGLSLESSTADIITQYTSGAGGLGNSSAWFILKMPGASRYLTFQRGTQPVGSTAAASWRIKYSLAAYDFSSATSTRTPTTTTDDDRVIFGGGTDASPLFAVLFQDNNSYMFNIISDNASPYNLCFFGYQRGGSLDKINTAFVLDSLLDATYPTGVNGDYDPYVIYVDYKLESGLTGCFEDSSLYGLNNSPQGYLGAKSSLNFTSIPANTYGFITVPTNTSHAAYTQAIPNYLPSNPYTNKDDINHILYLKTLISPSLPAGYKGYSNFMKWIATTRQNLSLMTITSSGDTLIVGDVCIPWNGSTPQV